MADVKVPKAGDPKRYKMPLVVTAKAVVVPMQTDEGLGYRHVYQGAPLPASVPDHIVDHLLDVSKQVAPADSAAAEGAVQAATDEAKGRGEDAPTNLAKTGPAAQPPAGGPASSGTGTARKQ